MGKLTLLLGGARSGKSSFAEKRAKELGGDNVLYVATSEVIDEEMRLRAEKHQAARPDAWATVEAPRKVAQAIRQGRNGQRVILLDCITVLVANLLIYAAGPEDDPFDDPSTDPFDKKIETEVLAEVEALADLIHKSDLEALIVSNEVGMGVVPPYELGRAYRDVLGRANQALARHADEVYFFVAGLPMQIKPPLR